MSSIMIQVINRETGEIEIDTANEERTTLDVIVHIYMREYFDIEEKNFLEFKFVVEDIALKYNVSIPEVVAYMHEYKEKFINRSREEMIQLITESISDTF